MVYSSRVVPDREIISQVPEFQGKRQDTEVKGITIQGIYAGYCSLDLVSLDKNESLQMDDGQN